MLDMNLQAEDIVVDINALIESADVLTGQQESTIDESYKADLEVIRRSAHLMAGLIKFSRI